MKTLESDNAGGLFFFLRRRNSKLTKFTLRLFFTALQREGLGRGKRDVGINFLCCSQNELAQQAAIKRANNTGVTGKRVSTAKRSNVGELFSQQRRCRTEGKRRRSVRPGLEDRPFRTRRKAISIGISRRMTWAGGIFWSGKFFPEKDTKVSLFPSFSSSTCFMRLA